MTGDVRKEEDRRVGEKSKMKWELLQYYHPSEADLGEIRISSADEEVREVLKTKALFAKYLQRGGVKN